MTPNSLDIHQSPLQKPVLKLQIGRRLGLPGVTWIEDHSVCSSKY
jgi:hypothetical protein